MNFLSNIFNVYKQFFFLLVQKLYVGNLKKKKAIGSCILAQRSARLSRSLREGTFDRASTREARGENLLRVPIETPLACVCVYNGYANFLQLCLLLLTRGCLHLLAFSKMVREGFFYVEFVSDTFFKYFVQRIVTFIQ